MSAPIRHTMLVANAGSGKTYALTTRMVKLLALGVEPRKIAALTFTKKAAGEFLDAVFLRLAFAATDPKKLSTLNHDLNIDGKVPPLDEAGCRDLLRKLTLESGGLSMGTIDSLFARIARAFPLESGLPGEFSMIGESELERARTEALAAIFRQSSQGDATAEFLDLVRKISRRQGERQVFRTLLQSVDSFHEQFLKDPHLPWGNPDLIWGKKGCAILKAGDEKRAADDLLSAVKKELPKLTDNALSVLEDRLKEAVEHKPGMRWGKNLAEFIKKKLAGDPKSSPDGAYFPMGTGANARVYLRGDITVAREELLLALLKPVYESLLEKSAALRRFMATFESSYHDLTRRRGKMTFSDVTDLLADQVQQQDWMASAGYRLDARLDHWLLDEFQDTSRIQWKVLGSFIDEVIQDSGGERSLFYVGDTKQAIYSWRGGDPKLFFEILEKYNRGSERRVHEGALDESYRSAPVIVEVVNEVFGSIRSHLFELETPEKTLSAWEKAWRNHRTAEQNKELKGYVRWEAVGGESGEEQSFQVDQMVVSILDQVRPWERALSCAVLTRKNDQAASIASLLQANGIPVSVEGKSNPCNDNPLGVALLAAFNLAASPEDSLSRVVLKSSPMAGVITEGEEIFRGKALESIASHGYEATARLWIEGITLNPFLSRRASDFLAAAAEYDASGRGSISEFTAYLESHSMQESEASGVVRVMTVHQSKGLTFDMTIVFGLDGKGANSTDTLHLGGGEPPAWGCLLPSKDLAEPDPVMSEAVDELRAEEEYGKLCTAYVSMTRSKQALYVLTKKLKEDTSAKNFARLLMLTLSPGSDVVERGEENWFKDHPVVRESSSEPANQFVLSRCRAGTPHPVSPSSLAAKKVSKKPEPAEAVEVATAEEENAFSLDAADLGTEIHEVLSRLEWDIAQVDLATCTPKARELLEIFLSTPESKALFSKPGAGWELWRERAFDLAIDGKWISGIFDRVHIRREGGKAIEAHILDYKTNRKTPEAIAEEYEGQMEQYRQAASRLLGLPLEKITAKTVPIRRMT